jgi:hypothetical protein
MVILRCPLCAGESADDIATVHLEKRDCRTNTVGARMKVFWLVSITGGCVAIDCFNLLVADQIVHELPVFEGLEQGTTFAEFLSRFLRTIFLLLLWECGL